MRLYILYSVLLLAVLWYNAVDANKVKFGPICSDNKHNNKRKCDRYGCGYFGAPRIGSDGVKYKHEGLDIVCSDGSTVYAPFDVELNDKATPYPNDKKKTINDGICLKAKGLCFKLFYVKPDSYSGTLKKGQKIGTLLPMQKVYPGITSHVHVQMCDKSDPTKYF